VKNSPEDILYATEEMMDRLTKNNFEVQLILIVCRTFYPKVKEGCQTNKKKDSSNGSRWNKSTNCK